jgi:hypothetical protein
MTGRPRLTNTDEKRPGANTLMGVGGPMDWAVYGPMLMPALAALHGPPHRVLITETIAPGTEWKLGVYRIDPTPVGWCAYWTHMTPPVTPT